MNIIGGVIISQDELGRFRLNDFHKAAGGNPKDRPGEWLRIDKTKKLIEIERQKLLKIKTGEISPVSMVDPISSIEGRNGGTYAVKKLVYAYATWISEEFFSHVLDVRADIACRSQYLR